MGILVNMVVSKMQIINKKIEIDTKGAGDLLNITSQVVGILDASKLKKGSAVVFVIGQLPL